MVASEPTQCPECSYANPPDARFCQRCGKKLVQTCRRCDAENPLQAQFCKSCGVELAKAQFGISNEKAKEWWEYFSSFAEFKNMTTGQGWVRNQVYPVAIQLLKASNPNALLNTEKMAFFSPIIDRDWCIRVALFNNAFIKSGALWAGTSEFALFDFTQRLVHLVAYEALQSVDQQGDTVNLMTNRVGTISLALRVPRPSKDEKTGRFLFDTISILGSKSISDQELVSQRAAREGDELRQRVQLANAFVEGIRTFFSRIIERKEKMLGT